MVKVTEEGKGELKFTLSQIEKMEQVAKARGDEAYLLLRLWGRRGLRVSESLKITKSDIVDKGVWIWQKGGERVLKILPPEVYEELSTYAKKTRGGLVFPISRMTAYNLSQSIAREAGIDNWQRAHPHRWRHFFRDLPGSENGEGPVEGKESDGPQGSSSHSSLRGQSIARRGIGGIVKVKPRFWMIGALSAILTYHSYGILSGVYVDMNILSYDDALILGVLEAFLVVPLTILFLWKTLVWWHDKPKSSPHVFHDAGIVN